MASWLREQLARRPAWMNALLAFSVFMAVVYVPWDFLCKPVSYDVEVWLGVALHGWAAKATEPLHWALYAAGAYGLWRMRPWMWPWASLYSAQVALGMLVWSVHVRGGAFGWLGGLVAALPFLCALVRHMHLVETHASRVYDSGNGKRRGQNSTTC